MTEPEARAEIAALIAAYRGMVARNPSKLRYARTEQALTWMFAKVAPGSDLVRMAQPELLLESEAK
jgi:hypothetical protein